MSKNKYFVFSDVHGEAEGLERVLMQAGYDRNNPNHYLISCGDAFDRGPYSAEVLRMLQRPRVIAIKGNHDCFLQEYLEKGLDGEYVFFNILRNGLNTTIESLSGRNFGDNIDIKEYQNARREIKNRYGFLQQLLQNMPLYYETKHFIFVHAGVDPRKENWKQTSEDFMLWDIDYSHISQMNTEGKIVVFGHHHTSSIRALCEDKRIGYKTPKHGSIPFVLGVYGNEDENAPIQIQNKIGLDGCTILTKTPNVLVIEDDPIDEGENDTVIDNCETRMGEYTDNIYTTTSSPFTYSFTTDGNIFIDGHNIGAMRW